MRLDVSTESPELATHMTITDATLDEIANTPDDVKYASIVVTCLGSSPLADFHQTRQAHGFADLPGAEALPAVRCDSRLEPRRAWS